MNKLNKIFLAFGSLYLVWHLGRLYEFKQVQENISKAYSRSHDTYFFTSEMKTVDPIPNAVADLFIVGEIEPGRCFTGEAEEELLHYVK